MFHVISTKITIIAISNCVGTWTANVFPLSLRTASAVNEAIARPLTTKLQRLNFFFDRLTPGVNEFVFASAEINVLVVRGVESGVRRPIRDQPLQPGQAI